VRNLVVWVIVISTIGASCRNTDQQVTTCPEQALVDTLVHDVANRKVGKVELLNIPEDMESFARITQDQLERAYRNKLIIRDIRDNRKLQDFLVALKSVRVTSRLDLPDLRWGIIIYSVEDERLGSLYIGIGGHNGAINDVPVDIDGRLYDWVRETGCGFR
jgi:hypothetical protein